MSDDDHSDAAHPPTQIDPTAARWVFLGMLGIVAVGFLAYSWLGTPPAPPPPEVASDPLLLEGRSVYLARCATCHGREGRGDGPIAGSLLGPPVGNISDGKWKHGGKPEEVLGVISKGVEGTRMAGWGQLLEPSQLRGHGLRLLPGKAARAGGAEKGSALNCGWLCPFRNAPERAPRTVKSENPWPRLPCTMSWGEDPGVLYVLLVLGTDDRIGLDLDECGVVDQA